MSHPSITVSLVTFCGSSFVEVRVHDVIEPNINRGVGFQHVDHLILIEPARTMIGPEGFVGATVHTDGFQCRSNVDCAFGDTVETAFEAHIDRAKSANRRRVGFESVVMDTIVPALEAHHDAIISQATTLLAA